MLLLNSTAGAVGPYEQRNVVLYEGRVDSGFSAEDQFGELISVLYLGIRLLCWKFAVVALR
jgi:hypothetical protein